LTNEYLGSVYPDRFTGNIVPVLRLSLCEPENALREVRLDLLVLLKEFWGRQWPGKGNRGHSEATERFLFWPCQLTFYCGFTRAPALSSGSGSNSWSLEVRT